MATEHLEEIPEGRIKVNDTTRKRRVSLKSTRVQRLSTAGLCASTRQRRISTAQRGHQRKRSLHHLFGYAPPPSTNDCDITNQDMKVTNIVTTSRRLSEAVAKQPTYITIEPSTGRRRSEPYVTNMFTTALNKRSSKLNGTSYNHGRKTHNGRKFSTAEALMIKNNRKLEALAQDELLTCLNVPLPGEKVSITPIDESDEITDFSHKLTDGDYISEEENNRRILERKKKEEKRKCIIRELLETERNYIACLDIVIDVFKHPLDTRNLVTHKDLKLMFPPSINEIQSSHCRFVEDLDRRVQNDDWDIGSCFQKITSISENLLEIYTRYVQSFPKSISTLTKYTRGSNKFRKFLDSCYRNPVVERLDLPSFLLSPVQRLPRYILLLSELYKYTDSGHPDKDCICETKAKMEKIIMSLDTSIKVSMESYSSDKKGVGSGIRRHFQGTKKKKRTLSISSCSGNEKKTNAKTMSNKNSNNSSIDIPSRENSNLSASDVTTTPPLALKHSPLQRRRTFDGYEDNGTLSVEIKRDRNNSWRKSLGAKLSNLFQPDRYNGSCNGLDNSSLSQLPLGTTS